MVELGRAGSNQLCAAGAGSCLYLGTAKNDDDSFSRPEAAVKPEHDAVDDPYLPGRFFSRLAQWLAPLLDSFQRHWHHHTIFHNRMGASLSAISQATTGTSTGPIKSTKP
jgi:hypothetical protein